jgi:hypothetical protein
MDEDAAELRRLANLLRTAANDSEDVLDAVVLQAGLDTWDCAYQRRFTAMLHDWGRLVGSGADATRRLAQLYNWEANRLEGDADEVRRAGGTGG